MKRLTVLCFAMVMAASVIAATETVEIETPQIEVVSSEEIVDDKIKTLSDLQNLYSKYFDNEFVNKISKNYRDINGKLYAFVGDAGEWEPCSEYTDEIEKISEDHYLYYIGGYSDELGEYVNIYYDFILEDGKWVFTDKYNDDHPDSPYYGFMPVYNASERIKD